MKHTGGCHCGKVRYEVEMKIENALSCNCSVCLKRGSLLDFVPEGNFRLTAGENNLTDYQFNKKVIHHLFCKDCGILSFGKGQTPDGNKVFAVNLRTIDDIDLKKLKINEYDGKSI